MIKSNRIFATSMAVLYAFCARDVCAAQNTPTLMSKYGEIQSVNKYSSNPFWTPNSPYNQRFPTPIYATGADLTAGDCNRIVGNLVSEYCAGHNYCSNSRLADIRPTVMVQLSQLPGHNFATSCGGYIDSIFENYKKTYGNTSTNNVVKPAQQNVATIQIENPFKQKKSEYEKGVEERTAELESLQRVTTPATTVTLTDFPKTIDDLSFTDRMANTTAGYEPYKNLNAYKTPKFETEDEYYERMKSVLTHTITYVGAGAPGCPAEYLTGRGTTVSCAPTRQNATCTDWCTDAEKTNCATEYKISPNDRDNKTFYGKCVCDNGYEDDGYKCVKIGTTNPADPVNPIAPVDSTPNNCPDPHMNTNCECTGKYKPSSSNPNVCECANGSDINLDCYAGETYTLLQCRLTSPDKIKQIGDRFDKSSGAQRYLYDCTNAINNHKLLDRCFTPCKSKNEQGYVNAIFESAFNNGDFPEFCTGREGDMPINFFMDKTRSDVGQKPLQLTQDQANAIIKGFRAFNGPITEWAPGPRIREKCEDSKPRVWVLYVLKTLGDNEYEITDREILSHEELLQ